EPEQTLVDTDILQVESVPSIENLSCGFDIVVSACVMTQLFHAAKVSRISEENQNRLIFALRKQHIQFMLSITKQNGTSILATDMSSFETDQDFSAVESCDVHEMMLELIDKKVFFTGSNPFALMNEIREKHEIVSQLKDAIFLSPWLWQMFKHRVYLVYALALLKK
ncbi:MAG TPA: hypothetical protein VFI33_04315, partial [Puia sp.]|nr:hypothetical protein [Puia sp.]